MKRWEEIFTEADRALLEKFARGERQSFGERPALIIVDVVKSFLGSKPASALDSAKEYRTSCGATGWEALQHIRMLLEGFRRRHLPVVFTTIDQETANHSWGVDKWSSPKARWIADAWEIADELEQYLWRLA